MHQGGCQMVFICTKDQTSNFDSFFQGLNWQYSESFEANGQLDKKLGDGLEKFPTCSKWTRRQVKIKRHKNSDLSKQLK